MKGRTHGNQTHPIMDNSLNLSQIESLQQRLLKHPVYDAVNDLSSLRVFMDHHVYGVWDFMSLLKHLQHVIAPSTWPWQPSANVSLRRFVNEIVLGEESDEGLPTTEGQKRYVSHFDFYCEVMREVQADPAPALEFISVVKQSGLDTAFASGIPPQPCIEFMRASFGFIETGKAHVVAAAFAFGRELIVSIDVPRPPGTHQHHRATSAGVLLLPAAPHPNGRGIPRPAHHVVAERAVWQRSGAAGRSRSSRLRRHQRPNPFLGWRAPGHRSQHIPRH